MFFKKRKEKEGLIPGIVRAVTQIGLPTIGAAALANYLSNSNVRNIRLKEFTDGYKQRLSKAQRAATSRLSLIGKDDIRRLRLAYKRDYQGFDEYVPAGLQRVSETVQPQSSDQPDVDVVEVPADANGTDSKEVPVKNIETAIERSQEARSRSQEVAPRPYDEQEGHNWIDNDQSELPSLQAIREEQERGVKHFPKNASPPPSVYVTTPLGMFKTKLEHIGWLASEGRKAVLAKTIRDRVLRGSAQIEIDITALKDSLANLPKGKKLAILTAGFLDPTGMISGVRVHRDGELVLSGKDLMTAIRNAPDIKNGNAITKRISETIALTSHAVRTSNEEGLNLISRVLSNPKNQGKVLDANYGNLFGGENPKYRRVLSALGLPELRINSKGVSTLLFPNQVPIRTPYRSRVGLADLTPKDYVDYRTASIPVPVKPTSVEERVYSDQLRDITTQAEADLAKKLGDTRELEGGGYVTKIPDNLYGLRFERPLKQLLISSPRGNSYRVMFSSAEEDSDDTAEFSMFKKKKKPNILRNLYILGGIGAGVLAGGLMIKNRLNKNAIKTEYESKIERLDNLRRINSERSAIRNGSQEAAQRPYDEQEGHTGIDNDQSELPSPQAIKEEQERKVEYSPKDASPPPSTAAATSTTEYYTRLKHIGRLASEGRKAVLAKTIRDRILGDEIEIIDIAYIKESLSNLPKDKKLAILTAGFLDPTGEISGVRVHRYGEPVSGKDLMAAIRNAPDMKNGNAIAKRISETIALTSHAVRTNNEEDLNLISRVLSNPKNQGKTLDSNYENLFGGKNPKYRRVLSELGLPELRITSKGVPTILFPDQVPISRLYGSSVGLADLTPSDYVDYRTASIPMPIRGTSIENRAFRDRVEAVTTQAEMDLARKLGDVREGHTTKIPDNLYGLRFERPLKQLLVKSPDMKNSYRVMFSSTEDDSNDIAEFFMFKKKKKPNIGKVIRNLYMLGGIGAGVLAGGLMIKDRLGKNAIKSEYKNKIERLDNLRRINSERSAISQARQHVLASDLAELSGGALSPNNPDKSFESVVDDAFNLLTAANQDIKETNGVRYVTSKARKAIFKRISNYDPMLSKFRYEDGKILSSRKVLSAVNRAVMLRARALRGGLSDHLASTILTSLPKQEIASLRWNDPERLKAFVEKVDMLDRDVVDDIDSLGRRKIMDKLAAGELSPKEFLDSSQSPRQYLRRKSIVNEIAGLPTIEAKNMPTSTDKYYIDDVADTYVTIPTNHDYTAGVTFLDPRARRPRQETYLVSHSTKRDRDKTKAFIATL